MAEPIIEVADDFWNIRGSYKIGGLIDIAKHPITPNDPTICPLIQAPSAWATSSIILIL